MSATAFDRPVLTTGHRLRTVRGSAVGRPTLRYRRVQRAPITWRIGSPRWARTSDFLLIDRSKVFDSSSLPQSITPHQFVSPCCPWRLAWARKPYDDLIPSVATPILLHTDRFERWNEERHSFKSIAW